MVVGFVLLVNLIQFFVRSKSMIPCNLMSIAELLHDFVRELLVSHVFD